jgi:hypothetical protein
LQQAVALTRCCSGLGRFCKGFVLKLYHLYGLAVASDFVCPELAEITPEQAAARSFATVRLTRADGPLSLPEGRQLASWMWATPDAALYQFDDIARLLVERPDRITVEMLPGAVESDMRAYLFGTGFGTLLHMRGLIPLHISAILTPEGAVAFTGPSGAGKSTRVAELHFRHGWPIICDDVAVLHPSDDQPLLHAGMNRLRLWKDAVERFEIDPAGLDRDLLREDKFQLLVPGMTTDRPHILQKLVVLGSDRSEFRSTSGGEILANLMNAIYRPELAAIFSDRGRIFMHLSSVAKSII